MAKVAQPVTRKSASRKPAARRASASSKRGLHHRALNIVLPTKHNGYHPHLLGEKALITMHAVILAAEVGVLAVGMGLGTVGTSLTAAAAEAPAAAIEKLSFAVTAEQAFAYLLLILLVAVGGTLGLSLIFAPRRLPHRAALGGAAAVAMLLGLFTLHTHEFPSANILVPQHSAQAAALGS